KPAEPFAFQLYVAIGGHANRSGYSKLLIPLPWAASLGPATLRDSRSFAPPPALTHLRLDRLAPVGDFGAARSHGRRRESLALGNGRGRQALFSRHRGRLRHRTGNLTRHP